MQVDGDGSRAGSYSLLIRVSSDDYPDFIEDKLLEVRLEVTCSSAELIMTSLNDFSPILQVFEPQATEIVTLPSYEPSPSCGLTEDSVQY